jgi:hypothetical protein
MLKMSFTVRMKLRLKGRCSRHPRYNPEQGEGMIRGRLLAVPGAVPGHCCERSCNRSLESVGGSRRAVSSCKKGADVTNIDRCRA